MAIARIIAISVNGGGFSAKAFHSFSVERTVFNLKGIAFSVEGYLLIHLSVHAIKEVNFKHKYVNVNSLLYISLSFSLFPQMLVLCLTRDFFD